MPSSAALEPSPELVDAWLQSLFGLLAPLRPTALALIASIRERTTIEWLDGLPEEQFDVRSRIPAQDEPHKGWLVPLASRGAMTFSLLLRSEASLLVNDPELLLAGSVGKSSFSLLWPRRAGLPRSALGECLHELRNGLNSVVMSAAIVGGPKLPDELRVFAVDLHNGTQRSMRALSQLSILLRD